MRFHGEHDDLETVRRMGEKWGFGNCIQYLQHAWADWLLERYYPQMDRKTCALSAHMSNEEAKSYVNGFSVLYNSSHKGINYGKDKETDSQKSKPKSRRVKKKGKNNRQRVQKAVRKS